MSARRERPPSGKVHRGGTNLANVNREGPPRPMTSMPRESTGFMSQPETFSIPGKDRPMSGRQTAPALLFNKQRPSTSGGARTTNNNNLSSSFNGSHTDSFNYFSSASPIKVRFLNLKENIIPYFFPHRTTISTILITIKATIKRNNSTLVTLTS